MIRYILKNPIPVVFISVILFPFLCPQTLLAKKDVFKTSYECHGPKGNPRWQAETEIFASPEKGENSNTLVETGSGYYTGFKEKVSWQSELEYTREADLIRPVKSMTKTYNSQGKLIMVESQEFDFISNTATFKREDKISDKAYSEAFKIKEDTVNRLMLGLYIQQLLRSGRDNAMIQMLSNEPRMIKCRLYIMGKEEIDINGQKRQAYKLCLDPQLGLFNFVKVFIPKAYVWHSAEPDFEWLKYNGLEVNLNSPIVEIKKTRFDI
jgi:hypothetical protein